MSAFVEIIFDNSDDRFPTGKPELTLRRTIGMKKDEYTLDRKNATKTDVMNLLESAGFSRSNPYYIVPQGRVTALTNMKDGERLNLLKEVAGTQVYEARRQESLKIMNETKNKREKIDELLKYILDRLSELEEEKEELKDYQDKDKDRRCLQYTIDHREQQTISEELENLEEQRQAGAEDNDDSAEQFQQGEKNLEDITSQIAELKRQVDFLKIDKGELESERKDSAKARAKAELDVKGLTEGQTAAQQARKEYESELGSVQASIKEHENQLKKLLPEYNAKLNDETQAKSELETAEDNRRRLYDKQGRNARFRNKKDRDDWLKEQINSLLKQIGKLKALRVQTDEDIAELEKDIAESEGEVDELRQQLERSGESDQNLQQQIDEAKAADERLQDERKELWRDDKKLDSDLEYASAELKKAEKELSKTTNPPTSRGLAAVKRFKQRNNIEGAYGCLAELMEVDDKFRTAVESTAGMTLFHYVVDTDVTAQRLIEMLQKEKAGRLTFIPLNRVKPSRVNLPNAHDALPLVSKIKFDRKFEPAFAQAFGGTVVCPNLTVAGQYVRSHGVNGVTMQGDRSDKKGAFTGGFVNTQRSRLAAIRNEARWRDECDNHSARMREVKSAVERKDQDITIAKGELRKLEQTLAQQQNSYGPLRQELRTKTAALDTKKDNLDKKQRSKTNIESNFKSLGNQQAALESEMNTAFKKELTAEEETLLENLISTTQDLRRQLSEMSSSRAELESKKSSIEIELKEHLRPRLDQLTSEQYDTQSSRSAPPGNKLKQAKATLDRLSKSLSTTESKLSELTTQIDNATNAIAALTNQHAEITNAQTELARAIEKRQKRMEKSIQKRRILNTQAAEVAGRIRDLGILPHGAMDKYKRTKSDSLVKSLHKVTEALKKYGHVNKKAFEQYNNFTTQRETLTKRREELDSSQQSIEELIQVLDQRKDEAIERTFKQVSKEFAGVFEKLVPAGRGRLVIQRKADRENDAAAAAAAAADEDESEDERAKTAVENYTGVGISVSFNSKHDDQQRIQQLSGGQKSESTISSPFPFFLSFFPPSPPSMIPPSYLLVYLHKKGTTEHMRCK